jgi:hypothetical protein
MEKTFTLCEWVGEPMGVWATLIKNVLYQRGPCRSDIIDLSDHTVHYPFDRIRSRNTEESGVKTSTSMIEWTRRRTLGTDATTHKNAAVFLGQRRRAVSSQDPLYKDKLLQKVDHG